MKNSYDLIIIGAGPAGLTAAKVAAGKGLFCFPYLKSKKNLMCSTKPV